MARPGGMKVNFSTKIVYNNFPAYAQATPRKTWYAVKKCGADIVKDVQGGPHAAPLNKKPPFVDTKGEDHPGALRRSYHSIEDLPNKTVTVENDPEIADYGPFVEFGTVNMAAQPHLIPATEAALVTLYRNLRLIPGDMPGVDEGGSGILTDTGLPY